MARTDAKTVSAAALLGLVAMNTARSPGPAETPTVLNAPIRRNATTASTTTQSIEQATDAKIRGMIEFREHTVHMVLATVADPDRTALRLNTDRTIDALLLAAFQEGYVLENHWIPWRFSLEQMDDDYSERSKQQLQIREQSKFPGVLVLERKKDILVMLLVPEGPTMGVDRDVLDRAVHYLTFDNDKMAPIIGPSFTGGLESLQEWLADWPEEYEKHKDKDVPREPPITRIVAGNITGVPCAKPGASLGADLKPNACENPPQFSGIPFQVIRAQRAETNALVDRYLEHTRRGRHDQVNLVEDSTRFGRNMKEAAGKAPRGAQTTTLSFPWQISRVRNAMPDLLHRDPRGGSDFGLQMQMRESRRPEGTLPTFAGSQTPAVQEVVLAQIAERLDRTDADYVNIVATDVMDALFLSRMLRSANPGQRVLTSQPDLVYLRAQDVVSTIGLLATASFPIANQLRLAESSNAVDAEPRRIVFDSDLSAATFTAALYTIRHQERPATYDFRVKQDGAMARPIWMLGLGRNGYWPVARIDEGETVQLERERPTVVWLGSFCVGVAACAIWLSLLLAAKFRIASGLSDIRVETEWPDWFREATSLTLVTTTAAAGFAIASAPLWWAPHWQQALHWSWTVAFWLGLAFMVAAGIVPWIHRTKESPRPQILLGLAAATPMIAALAIVAFGKGTDPNWTWRFFLLRSQDYLNGIAPLLPLAILMLGFLGVAWSNHFGVVLTQERFIRLGALGAPKAAEGRSNYWILLGCAVAAAPIVFIAGSELHSLEPLTYDRLFIVLMGLLLLATNYACVRFIEQWQRVKAFLMRLEIHPIRDVLEGMPLEKDGAPIWESQPRRRSTFFYSKSYDALKDLRAFSGAEPGLDDTIEELRRYLKLKGRGQVASRLVVEQSLALLAERFEKELESEGGPWSSAPRPPSAIDRKKQEFLVHRLSAFLRNCFLYLRNYMTAMTAGFAAITLSLNSYAFGPERMIQAFTIGLIALIGAAVVSVFVQMHRNTMLAMLSGAKTGSLDWGMWARIASAAAVPVLTLMASYTPAIGKFVSAWLQPALETIAK